MKPSTFPALFTVCSLLALAGTASAENWPVWRGPDYDGISKERNLPTEWGADKNVVWKCPLPGKGCSTPVIWDDHIFLTSAEDNDLLVVCISTAGKQLWKQRLGTGEKMHRIVEGDNASATPSTDGKYVWAFVGSGDLGCYDFAGKEIWKFNVQDRYGKFDIQFGMHSTPLLYQDRLYLQLIHTGGAWVVALDKNTGKEIWKVARKSDGTDENKHSYASPVLWHKDKSAYLITHGGDYSIAHRLEDGSEIWRCADLNPRDHYNTTLRFVASPVATPDLIVVPSAKNGPVVGVKPDASGLIKAGSPGEQWRMAHGTPDVPCPLVVDGLVYLCNADSGALTCLDAKTGEEKYPPHRTSNQHHRGSPVYADGKIYLTGRLGSFTVVKAGPTFEVLATNKLPDTFVASPAVANGRIYLRGFEALYAIGTPEGK